MRFILIALLLTACTNEEPPPEGLGHFRRGDLRHPTCIAWPDGGMVCLIPCKADEDCPTGQVCHPVGKRCVAK